MSPLPNKWSSGKAPAFQGAAGPPIHMVQSAAKKCYHCEKRDHVPAKCWKRHPELRPQRDYTTKAEQSASGSPGNQMQIITSIQTESSAGPADFQETDDQHCEQEGDDPLYPRTATTVGPGLGRY
jgi:hypothetical protein